MKKFWSLILTICLLAGCLAVVPISVSAEATSGTCGDNVTWSLDGNGTLTISGSGAMEDWEYLYKNSQYYVPAPWYDHRSSVKNVIISDGITHIGDCAFLNLDNLSSVTMPDSVSSIGDNAFYICVSLTSITIPDSVVSIGSLAFCDCENLSSITLSSNLKMLGVGAFSDTAYYEDKNNWTDDMLYLDGWLLDSSRKAEKIRIKPGTIGLAICAISNNVYNMTEIYIPDSVQFINGHSIDTCYNLQNIYVDDNNPYFCSIDGKLFTKDRSTIVRYPTGKENVPYTLPAEVTTIGAYAFRDAYGCKVTLPPNLITIEEYGLSGTEFDYLPETVKYIGDCAFEESTTKIIKIPKTVEYIGETPFLWSKEVSAIHVDGENPYYSSLDGVLFNKDKTELIYYPPAKATDKYIVPNGVTKLLPRSFQNANVTEVILPETVNSIGELAFHGSKLTEIKLPDGIEIIEHMVLYACENLKNVHIPESVTTIKESAFDLESYDLNIFYGGTEEDWKNIDIDTRVSIWGYHHWLECANLNYAKLMYSLVPGAGITLNGKKLVIEDTLAVEKGRILVPMRVIFEALGADVQWIQDGQRIISTKENDEIELQIGSKFLTKNVIYAYSLDVAPRIIGSKTFVPVRAIAESFNCKVDWDDATQMVIIEE